MKPGVTKSFAIAVLVMVSAFICCLAQAQIITNVPIEVINPIQIGTGQLEAERIPIGVPGYTKPSIVMLDDGELLLSVVGVVHRRHPEDELFRRDALLFRSKDGGRTWVESTTLPLGYERTMTILKDGVIFASTQILAKEKLNSEGFIHWALHRSADRGVTWTSMPILLKDMPNIPDDINISGCRSQPASIRAARDIFEFDDGSRIYGPWPPLDGTADTRIKLRVRNIIEIADNTHVVGPWITLPLIDTEDLADAQISPMIGGTRNILELNDGTLLFGVGFRNGYSYMWRSKDRGLTWDKNSSVSTFEGIKPELLWWPVVQETLLYESMDGNKLFAICRGDEKVFGPVPGTKLPENSSDQSERMIVFESTDGGKTWGNSKGLGGYGEMFPSILKLRDGRLLLTYTVRSINPKLGVRAVLGYEDADGLHFDFENDRIMVDTRTPEGFKEGGSGYGNTVQLSDGTLVTTYTYRGKDNQTHLEVVRWKLPPKAN